MTDRRSGFKQSDVTRALKAARAAGYEPSGMRIDPATGAIDLKFPSTGAKPASNDDFDSRFDDWAAS